jgi:hypothetical protein
MKKVLHQYFKLSEAELTSLWGDACISFDASVLLNIYAYSSETREELITIFASYSDRLYLSHQFALEYARNRPSVIVKQISNYQAAEKALKQIANDRLAPKTEHPHLSKEALKKFRSIQAELETSRQRLEKLIGMDPFCDLVLSTFEGKVGPEPTPEELVKLHASAKDRFDNKFPPGYEDQKSKKVPDCYGDYIGWKQLIDIAVERNKNIIFVTDDVKTDWWQFESERTVGPRPELIEEFVRTTGHSIWIYNSASFLHSARKYNDTPVAEKVIEEILTRLETSKDLPDSEKERVEGGALRNSDPDKDKTMGKTESPTSRDKATPQNETDKTSEK